MKQEEILKLKLFETYKLSEFFLNSIAKNTEEEVPENPYNIAKKYSHTLKEIVAKYDRLLDDCETSNKSRNFTNVLSSISSKSAQCSPKRNLCSKSYSLHSMKDRKNYICELYADSDSDSDEDYDESENLDETKTDCEEEKDRTFYVCQQVAHSANEIFSNTCQAFNPKIEKSFSNLSKDSGFMSSYHSDISFSNSNHALSDHSNIASSYISEQSSENDECESEATDKVEENSRNHVSTDTITECDRASAIETECDSVNDALDFESGDINSQKRLSIFIHGPISELVDRSLTGSMIADESLNTLQYTSMDKSILLHSSMIDSTSQIKDASGLQLSDFDQTPIQSRVISHCDDTEDEMPAFDYDNLMNVSMIDNIELNNRKSVESSMYSSILSFK